MKESPYFERARLMLRVLPAVAEERCFALKGGTAINFFLRDMPRLSVDIDLAYLPLEPRDVSLNNISEALRRIGVAIKKSMSDVRVQEAFASGSRRVKRLFVSDRESTIGIEPNEVIRGTVHPCMASNLSKKAERLFELSASINRLSLADLFGGKLCAALDRQHPRDLFDVKVLLEKEGITDEIRRAFVVYLACHDRPIHEVIEPTRKDIKQHFENQFLGMATEPVELDELISARESLVAILKKDLTLPERQFLVSVKEGTPQWDLLGLPGIENLPALQWKVMNVQKMDPKKHKDYLKKLKAKLDL
ncbi:MAG TPA: nucleotidyl transferase AbiEii/AbiGii toxin family protein, partial [bacterium]|nr:nucleotidyl transferase AbiEii/AbiGii toxin family protein [bacterium]